MKKKKNFIGKGLNKLVYDLDELPIDGTKLPLDQLGPLIHDAENLGVKLAKTMMGYGFDYYGTFVRTYALSQMLAYVKVFSKAKGFDAMAMFKVLTPKFTKEAQQMLEEILNDMNNK